MRFYYGYHVTRAIIKICLYCLFLSFVSCSNQQNTPPNPEEKEDGKTYLKIENNTKYAVNVHIDDPPIYNDTSTRTLRRVPADGSGQWELQPTPAETRTMLYFEYLIPVGSTTIPYYPRNAEYVKTIILEAGKTNSQEVPSLLNAQTDSIFVLIKNTSRFDPFWVRQGNATKTPFGSTVSNIPAERDALFVFDGNTASLDGYTIGDVITWNFPSTSLEKGKIYSFMFDGKSEPGLFLIEPFDIEMQKSIWTIPTYNEPVPKGRFFTVGLLSSRANVKTDGYILTGKINYDLSTVTSPYVGAVPYLGMISPIGEVTRERRITLNVNPAGLNLQSFIEDSNELIYVGQAYYEDMFGKPCILSTDTDGRENYFYDKFADDINNNRELYGRKLVKWNANNYAVGCQLWESNRQQAKIVIVKVNKNNWDEVTHQEFWESPENDYASFVDLVFDQTYNILVVLADTGAGSAVYFIDAGDGTLKYPTIYLNNYWINGLFTVGQDYYVAGGYKGVSSYRGFITKIDVVNGRVDTQNPWIIDPTKYENGAGSFRYILPESDGTLILAGWCVENSSNVELSNYRLPWLIKYNLNTRKKIWEQIYDDYIGYYTNSTHHNAIGSYLLEIYNDETYHSFLVSTDLLGKMTNNFLQPLPRNTLLFNAAQPGNPGISAVIVPMEDVSLSTSLTVNLVKGQNATITAQGTWTSYQWYVDGNRVSNTNGSYNFSTTDRNAGLYTVTVIVTNSANEKRSASCRITVTN